MHTIGLPRALALVVLVAAAVLPPARARGQASAPGPARDRSGYVLAVNPAYFIIGGYGVKAGYDFPSGWSVFAVGQRIGEVPEGSVESFFEGHEGIDVEWDYALGVEGWYRFDRKRRGSPYLIASLGYEGWEVTARGGGGSSDYVRNAYASLGAGYRWFPLERHGLFLSAHYNVIALLDNTDERRAGGAAYALRDVIPGLIPSPEIGWRATLPSRGR